jgi:hypothetical protein
VKLPPCQAWSKNEGASVEALELLRDVVEVELPSEYSSFSRLATVEGRRRPSHSTDSASMRLRPLRTLNELNSLRTCIPAGLCVVGMVGASSMRSTSTNGSHGRC